MTAPVPPPADLDRRPRELLAELTSHLSEAEVVAACTDVLGGADPAAYDWLLPYLAGVPGTHYLRPGQTDWADFWPRSWAARALLYVWDDRAADIVVAGVGDPAWRVAEHCLKVARRHELPVGDAAVGLTGHDLPRVRVAAVRALGRSGDTEHVRAVEVLLDDDDETVRKAAREALEEIARRLDQAPDRGAGEVTRG